MTYDMMADPVPVVLYGGGNYALRDVKEIQVTAEFLSLGPATTGCQDKQYKSDCSAAQGRKHLINSPRSFQRSKKNPKKFLKAIKSTKKDHTI